MKTSKGSVLVIDDDRMNRELLAQALRQADFTVTLAAGGEEALASGGHYDVVLSDLKMAPLSGLDVLDAFRKTAPETPVILLTAFGSVEAAIEAMKRGAFDYITKPVNLNDLIVVATRAVEQCRLVRENRQVHTSLSQHLRTASMIGQSRNIVEVFKLVGKVAPSKTTVLIQGESGTGKELIARAIHENSPRALKPFVAVNCSAMPDSLLESELFGHVKGSFTGAQSLRRGLLEEADGGTFFLDEVGDLSAVAQAKLLRALQEREIRRVGSNETIPIDLRVIAASRRHLPQLVQIGRFREDLLYRLNTVTITLPPLRERPEDIPLLAEFFLSRYGADKDVRVTALSSAAMQILLKYPWPGNVRELQHVIERAVTLATHSVLSVDDLAQEIRVTTLRTGESRLDLPGTLSALQRERIFTVLESMKGNKEQTARLLGISRRTLYRFLARHGGGRTATHSDPLDDSTIPATE
ncbi:MAG: Response regulator of zinc sigma-54-dependent two-component system [Nitrospira sp.]|nr:MAG: Response regulator of zinc sigma-54-dependent two-component system [Nitrospira sp.]